MGDTYGWFILSAVYLIAIICEWRDYRRSVRLDAPICAFAMVCIILVTAGMVAVAIAFGLNPSLTGATP